MSIDTAAEYVEHYHEALAEIHEWVTPYGLPDDFLFFLHFSGGLLVETPSYNLMVDGIGPMVEEWYGFLMGDDSITEPQRDGVLHFGALSFKQPRAGWFPRVEFVLDLAGIAQQNGVLAIEALSRTRPPLTEILSDFSHHGQWAKILVPSFADFLNLAASTSGHLGYGT